MQIPVSWSLITLISLTLFAAVLSFLAVTSFSSDERASGIVVPRGGILTIRSSRQGSIEQIFVHAGQLVRAGDSLVMITSDGMDRSGRSLQEQQITSVDEQIMSLDNQLNDAKKDASEAQVKYSEAVSRMLGDIKELDFQIALQGRMLEIRRIDFGKTRAVAERGYVSKSDLLTKEENLLAREQQLMELKARRSSKFADIDQARHDLAYSVTSGAKARSEIAVRLSSLRGARASALGSGGSLLRAPIAGRISSIIVHRGESVQNSDPVMVVVPESELLVAQMEISAKGVGVIHAGQPVRLAMTAFPRDRYGMVPATVTYVSPAPAEKSSSTERHREVYIAYASIPRPWLGDGANRKRLQPGMSFEARVVTDERTALGWLLHALDTSANR